jgi:hypothetical protein
VPVDRFNGTLIPTTLDPLFAVTLHIESSDPKVDELLPYPVVTFGIHSPTLLFGSEHTKGRSYDLCLRREEVNGKTKFSYLARLTEKGQCLGWPDF